MSSDPIISVLLEAASLPRRGSDEEYALIGAKISRAILDQCSETEDNVSAFSRLRFGPFTLCGDTFHGPLAGSTSVSEILCTLEDHPCPEHVKAEHPHLTDADWAAAMRLAVIVFTSFDSKNSVY